MYKIYNITIIIILKFKTHVYVSVCVCVCVCVCVSHDVICWMMLPPYCVCVCVCVALCVCSPTSPIQEFETLFDFLLSVLFERKAV